MPHRYARRSALASALALIMAGDCGAGSSVGSGAGADAALPDHDAVAENEPAPPPLQLAQTYTPGTDPAIDPGAYWVSEKLDGVRAYWDGRRLISRGGHPINAPAWFTADFPAVPLDGELWMGRGRFAAVSGIARRLDPDDAPWREVRYMLFDLPASDATFGERLAELRRLAAASANPWLQVVEQRRVTDHAALHAMLRAVRADGGEGLMLHRDDARHGVGRSDDLLKLKPYMDAEARVVAHLPGQGKYTGMLGALLVELPDGRRFRIGTGFSDAERASPPVIGSLISFKYHGHTKTGLPRFASFLRVRDDPR